MELKIAVLPGDGIGPEIMKQGIAVLNEVADKFSHKFTYTEALCGAHAIDAVGDPFPDDTFYHVVFDPPHLVRAGPRSWLAAKYGKLGADWQKDLRKGLAECFRVLKPKGTLMFKWNEVQIPLKDILALTGEQPLYGHRGGRQNRTHWVAFMKPDLPSSIS